MGKVNTHKRAHYSWDEYAARKAKEYLNVKGDLSEVETELNKAYNLIKTRSYSKAGRSLDAIDEEFDLEGFPDLKAYSMYLRAK